MAEYMKMQSTEEVKMSTEKCFLLENICCPNCAANLEKKLSVIDGVNEANVNFVTKKLTLILCDGVQEELLENDIRAAVKSLEPDIRVLNYENAKNDSAEKPQEISGGLIRLIVGAAAYAAGFIAVMLHAGPVAAEGIFIMSLIISGGEVFYKAVRNLLKGQVFDENLLMSIASISAFAIGQYEEGAAVMLFNQVGEYFQELAAERSKKSISELMNLRPDYANLITAQGTKRVSPEKVKIGELIEIKPGEMIPLDGTIVSGSSFADTSALTGEPVPRRIAAGGSVTGGFINGSGLLTVKVEKPYNESTVAKIIDLVENSANKKAKAENFITKFARYYTPAVTAAALIIALIPPLLFAQPFHTWLYRAIIFLVVSCPCAVVVSVPMGFFAGIGAASHKGILIKGGNYLEKLASIKTVVFDKTGTLTYGVFEVKNIICADGVLKSQLLEAAAYAEVLSAHPIAKSILKAYGKVPDNAHVESFQEIAGMGIILKAAGSTISVGSEKLMEREQIAFEKCRSDGTLVYTAKDGAYLGCIVISDTVKSDAAKTLSTLRTLGVKKTVMLTGDSETAARSVAAAVGIDEVRWGLLPDRKVSEFEKSSDGSTVFVGDGINDAPVLARADIGIAMGGAGSDAAVEAADIVIMDDNPLRIVTAMKISRYVRAVVAQNIIFALTVKFAVLILGALGYANIWEAVFADTGVAVLAVLNSLRTMYTSKF
jgi:Cd2+/Zn2+-exporting ATPase